MTKQETIKIMAMLGAFYSGGKNDPQIQAQAWYMILYKYDFEIAQKAVLNFAENDRREYATFPAVGKIVEAIKAEKEKQERPVNEVIMAISYGRDYAMLSEQAKALIDENAYKEWGKVDASEFNTKMHTLRDALVSNRKMIGAKKW